MAIPAALITAVRTALDETEAEYGGIPFPIRLLVKRGFAKRTGHDFGAWRMPWNADSGFHTGIAHMPALVPLATARDYENYIARLRATPEYVRQQIQLLRDGLRAGPFDTPPLTPRDARPPFSGPGPYQQHQDDRDPRLGEQDRGRVEHRRLE